LFNGADRIETTVYEYDQAGRVVRTVTRSTDWLEEDTIAAIELENYEADTCQGCGGQRSETTISENEFAYTTGTVVRCHQCTAADIAQEQLDAAKLPHPSALYIPMVLRGTDNDH
jgi:hypothetical protein